MVLLAHLLACTPTVEDTDAPALDTNQPATDTDAPEPEVVYELDPEGVVSALHEVLAAGLPVQTDAMFEAYQELLAAGDPGSCPPDSLQLDGSSCTSTTGYTYAGLSTYMEIDEGGQATWVFSADMEILTPDGDVYDGGGMFARTDGADAYSTSGFVNIGGTWGWTGFDNAWGDGVSAALSAGAIDSVNGRQVILDGSVTMGTTSVGFDEVSWSNESCEAYGVEGVLHVRTTTGHWYRLEVTDPCSACGTVYAPDDEPLGEACLDASAAFQATFDELLPAKP